MNTNEADNASKDNFRVEFHLLQPEQHMKFRMRILRLIMLHQHKNQDRKESLSEYLQRMMANPFRYKEIIVIGIFLVLSN